MKTLKTEEEGEDIYRFTLVTDSLVVGRFCNLERRFGNLCSQSMFKEFRIIFPVHLLVAPKS